MSVRLLPLAIQLFAGPAHARTLDNPMVAMSVVEGQQQPAKPASPDEFVPVNAPINAQDTIPAPRLVALAYGFIWVVLFGYVWSVRSRLASVERELQTVSKRVGSGGRPA
jgi:CcmD family protein